MNFDTTKATYIGDYQYVYGAGNAPNRKIQFYHDDAQDTIFAKRQGKINGVWEEIPKSGLDERYITKEGASLGQKVKLMVEARKHNQTCVYPPDRPFSQLLNDEKVQLIKLLEPEGKWRIEISNTIGENPRFEEVKQLIFFDPSS